MSRTKTSLWVALVCLLAAIISSVSPRASAQIVPEEDVTALIAQARESVAQNNIEAAIATLDQVIAKDPQNQEARQLRGDLYFKIGDMDKAMADYGELRTDKAAAAVAAAPPPPRPDWLPTVAERFRNASEEIARGRLDAAIDHYNAILAMDVPHPTASTALQNRGNVYRQMKDSERALRDFEQALRLHPANAGAYVNRGGILAERGDHDAAILDYSEAIRFDSKLAQAFFNRAVSFATLERWEAALRDFDEAVRLEPRSAAPRAGRGELFMMRGQAKRARAEFEAAKRLEPKMTAPWLGLARLEYQAGRFSAAAALLDKGISLNPDAPTALNFSAWLHATAPVAAARDGKKAIERALKACELTEWAQFGYVDTLAAAYAEAGDFEKAVDFQWYALSLIEGEEEHPNRAEAEERLRLFEQRQKYRESKPREPNRRESPGKKEAPDSAPTPPTSRQPSGRVGKSSPPLRPSADRADFARALARFCA